MDERKSKRRTILVKRGKAEEFVTARQDQKKKRYFTGGSVKPEPGTERGCGGEAKLRTSGRRRRGWKELEEKETPGGG